MIRAHGIDVSVYQTFFDAAAKPDDIDFIIMRVSYGITTDEKYDAMLAAIDPVPIRGAYHYFSSKHPWRKQADCFLKLVKDKGFHFYALDIETAFNEKSEEFAMSAQEWLIHVAQETGQKVLLYTNPNVYSNWLLPFGNWMKGWPLWIAQYWDPPGRNKKPGLPLGVSEWKLWQYSSDVIPNKKGKEYGVGSESVDLNVYNGTVEEMLKWLGLDSPDPPVEPDEIPTAVTTWRDVMDAAKLVATKHSAVYFTWLREAGAMAAARDMSLLDQEYEGPPISEWPLPEEIRAEIQDQLQL